MSQIRYNDENYTTDWIEQVLGRLLVHSKRQNNGVKRHSAPLKIAILFERAPFLCK